MSVPHSTVVLDRMRTLHSIIGQEDIHLELDADVQIKKGFQIADYIDL